MTIRVPFAAAGIALLLASPGWAQSATTSTGTSTTNSTGSFANLSPGNQKIADALFAAQKTTGTTVKPFTKNQIADLKGTEGWGRVFKEMKADGLIDAKNLGQIVSGHASTTSTTGRSASTTTTATNQRGGTTTAALAGARSNAGSTTRSTVSNIGAPNGRNSAAGSSAMGGGVAVSSMGGFGHAGMGGGFGGGMGGGHGGGMGGGRGGGGHGR